MIISGITTFFSALWVMLRDWLRAANEIAASLFKQYWLLMFGGFIAVFNAIKRFRDMLWEIYASVDKMGTDFGMLDSAAASATNGGVSSEVADFLAFLNYGMPVAETVILLEIVISIVVTCILYRLIKAHIPTLA